jgi:hypothetical protein
MQMHFANKQWMAKGWFDDWKRQFSGTRSADDVLLRAEAIFQGNNDWCLGLAHLLGGGQCPTANQCRSTQEVAKTMLVMIVKQQHYGNQH